MKDEGRFCPQNFQVWVAFVMGMIVIIIAIIVFNKVSTGRYGADRKYQVDTNQGRFETYLDYAQQTSSFKEDEEVTWLGVEAVDVNRSMARQMGLDISGGVLVSKVIESSPADKAGLKRGDIIYEFEHREIKDSDQLSKLLEKSDPGDRVRLDLIRKDEHETIYVVLGKTENKDSTSSARKIAGEVTPSDQRWGIVISELTDFLRKSFDIPDSEKGVVVMMVVPGSAADKARLNKGDLIKQVNQTRVTSIYDFFEALPSDENDLLLTIYRRGVDTYVHITAVPPGQVKGFSVAQEGIGMNRPMYVPGYDQTQSGEPDEKTRSSAWTDIKVTAGDSDSQEDYPVCKRITELDSLI